MAGVWFLIKKKIFTRWLYADSGYSAYRCGTDLFFDENKGILKWSGQEIVIPSPSYYNIFMVNIPYSQ